MNQSISNWLGMGYKRFLGGKRIIFQSLKITIKSIQEWSRSGLKRADCSCQGVELTLDGAIRPSGQSWTARKLLV